MLRITHANNISGVPVTEDGKLVGIVTGRDLRFETRPEDPVRNIMTRKDHLVTVREGASREEVVGLLHKHRIEKVLVVNDAFELRGLITVKDIQKAKDFPKASRDDHERLRVGAAVGVGGGTTSGSRPWWRRGWTWSWWIPPTAIPREFWTGCAGSRSAFRRSR